MLESDARLWSTLLNVATPVGMFLSAGTLSVFAVLIVWLIFRERSALVDFHGKQQLNANITLLVGGIAAMVVGFITLGFGFILTLPAILIYAIYLFVVSIVAAVAANRGEYYQMGGVIRFVK